MTKRNTNLTYANSADVDKKPQFVESDLGLLSLLISFYRILDINGLNKEMLYLETY